MSVLRGKNILLGISAGIAAYKSASLVRCFIKSGAYVKVVMTPASKEFITPLTLSTLSQNPVYSSFTDDTDDNTTWNNHVELSLWADFLVIAPATANTLSKMAHGVCDNILLAVYLSAKCPVYFAPAMDLDMYKHPTTKQSLKKLQNNSNIMIPAETGELASGLVGKGRMAEPETIVSFIEQHLLNQLPLFGKKVLITAGSTHEAIDPVRYIGNHSSGKMGYAIAEAAANLGATVILISGPTHQKMCHTSVTIHPVVNAESMYHEAHKYFKDVDIAILAAAVADYKPKTVALKKIKKQDETFTITLKRTKDILKSLGEIKEQQFLVGFALETENAIENAKTKLKTKNLDLIVVNSLEDKGAGFGVSTNKVTFITSEYEVIPQALKPKTKVALSIMQQILTQHYA